MPAKMFVSVAALSIQGTSLFHRYISQPDDCDQSEQREQRGLTKPGLEEPIHDAKDEQSCKKRVVGV